MVYIDTHSYNLETKMASQGGIMILNEFYPGIVQTVGAVIFLIAIIVVVGCNINTYCRERSEKQSRTNVTNQENRGLLQSTNIGY